MPKETYTFRPYNLTDVQNRDLQREHSFEAELNSWGRVNIVMTIITGNKPYPMAYLTNEHNDILYEFTAPYPTDTEILQISLQDVNEDGLYNAFKYLKLI